LFLALNARSRWKFVTVWFFCINFDFQKFTLFCWTLRMLFLMRKRAKYRRFSEILRFFRSSHRFARLQDASALKWYINVCKNCR
jgi:hypothetical protein